MRNTEILQQIAHLRRMVGVGEALLEKTSAWVLKTTCSLLQKAQRAYSRRFIPKEYRAKTKRKPLIHWYTTEEVQEIWNWDEDVVLDTNKTDTKEIDLCDLEEP